MGFCQISEESLILQKVKNQVYDAKKTVEENKLKIHIFVGPV